MTANATTTGPILVGVDGSPEARAAAAYAALRAAGTSGVVVLLAHAYWTPSNPFDIAGAGMIGQLQRKATELVHGLAAELRLTCSVPVETVVEAAKPVPFLGRLAGGASTVVVGQDAATLFDRVRFGSVAGHVAATAPCPVVIVPAAWHPSSLAKHPVVALTGDCPAHATLSTAIAEAKQAGTSVLALCVVPKAAPPDEVARQQRDLAVLVAAAHPAEHGVTVETRIIAGHPDELLVQESVSAAAVIVGRPRQHGVTDWMRSVAHAVMRRTHCPLIIVPAG
jgi:nucleotide-binding universal stress UspA family protein